MTLVMVSVTDRGLIVVGDTAVSDEFGSASGAAKVQFEPTRKVAFAAWGNPSILRDRGYRMQVDRMLAEFIQAGFVVERDTIQEVAEIMAAQLRLALEKHKASEQSGRKMPWCICPFGIYVAGYDEESEEAVVRVVVVSTNSHPPGPPRVIDPGEGLRVMRGGLPQGVTIR